MEGKKQSMDGDVNLLNDVCQVRTFLMFLPKFTNHVSLSWQM